MHVDRRECIDLVKEIGQVEHVVLTTHAYEHKLFVAPFARKFPGCQVRPVRALHSDQRLATDPAVQMCALAHQDVTASEECRCTQVWTSPGQWSFPVNLPVQVRRLRSCYSAISKRR